MATRLTRQGQTVFISKLVEDVNKEENIEEVKSKNNNLASLKISNINIDFKKDKVYFENTEGTEYLKAVLDAYADRACVGFCWDSGHEMCYNFSENLLAQYGHKLIATHINDNLGIKSFEGEIFWHDDLHLLPYDGMADWKELAHRLNKCGYNDILTFELNNKSKPNRHENDKYDRMPIEEYIAECYIRACRFANDIKNDK